MTALKHGVATEDIGCAMSVPLVDILLERHFNKYLLIGFDLNGNLLEIMYNMVDGDTANIFHAIKCRKEFYKYIPGRL